MNREQVIKESGSVAAFRCGEGKFFCKIYKFRNIFHSLKRTFRTPRAFRCFAGARLLAEKGFATPEPLAAAVRSTCGVIPLQQILLTRALPGETVYLDKALRDLPPAEAEMLLKKAAGFAAKLHGAGFIHGDMSLRNFYCLPDPENFGVIDLDGMLYCPRGVPRQLAARELARLISSAYRCHTAGAIPREQWLQTALQSYRDQGGFPLRPEDLAGTIDRLQKHRSHPAWKG